MVVGGGVLSAAESFKAGQANALRILWLQTLMNLSRIGNPLQPLSPAASKGAHGLQRCTMITGVRGATCTKQLSAQTHLYFTAIRQICQLAECTSTPVHLLYV